MKWVPLYMLTALITGLYNFYELMNMVNGAPVNLLNCISLLGSATLLGAALLLLLRVRAAMRVGLLGSILCWVFYAPLVFVSIFAPFSTWREIRFDLSFRDYIPVLGRLFGSVLLILCTANSVILARRNRPVSQTVP